MNSHDVIITKL